MRKFLFACSQAGLGIIHWFFGWWWLLLIIAVCGVGFYASLSQEPYKIITIDGCEYIKSNLAEVPLIHKANCPNHE